MIKSIKEQLDAIGEIMPEQRKMSPYEMCCQIIDCADRGIMGKKFNADMFRSISNQINEGRTVTPKQLSAIENTYIGFRVGEKY